MKRLYECEYGEVWISDNDTALRVRHVDQDGELRWKFVNIQDLNHYNSRGECQSLEAKRRRALPLDVVDDRPRSDFVVIRATQVFPPGPIPGGGYSYGWRGEEDLVLSLHGGVTRLSVLRVGHDSSPKTYDVTPVLHCSDGTLWVPSETRNISIDALIAFLHEKGIR